MYIYMQKKKKVLKITEKEIKSTRAAGKVEEGVEREEGDNH